MGKSRLIEQMALQRAAQLKGLAVIDVAGDLADHLISHLALLSRRRPQLSERIVIINPTDPTYVVPINPFETMGGVTPERVASYLTDVVVKVWRVEPTAAPRMIRLLTFSFLAIAELKLTLSDLPRFLTDTGWRNDLLAKLKREEVVRFFAWSFPIARPP